MNTVSVGPHLANSPATSTVPLKDLAAGAAAASSVGAGQVGAAGSRRRDRRADLGQRLHEPLRFFGSGGSC
jgi:hypothetical protein